MATPAIELLALTKRLPSGERLLTILDRVDLAVDRGEFVAILGPSGSGKSTLLGLAAGLDRPTAGEVRIDGRPIQDLSEDELARLRRRRIGFVFQSFQLLPNLTALENVLLPLELAGRDRRAGAGRAPARRGRTRRARAPLPGPALGRRATARRAGARVRAGAGDSVRRRADRQPRRRDRRARARAADDAARPTGTTLVLVTHDPAVAARADRRVHLRDGRIDRIELGRPRAAPPVEVGG